MTIKYTRLDENNVAVVETKEQRTVLFKSALEKQKTDLIEAHENKIAEIDEALAEFDE